LADKYPGSAHVRDVGLLGAEDWRIWTYAADHEFLIVSKDNDFYQRGLVHGAPPKVIWLRVGNAPTLVIAALPRERYAMIQRFLEDADAVILPLR
jgi:predicted nuclease of predicted toxin-antitoxin system